jgi:hypothetical protein
MEKNSYIGIIGTHHDYKITIERILEFGQDLFLEASDRLDRKMLIRVTEREEQARIEEKGSIIFRVFRGQIMSHSVIFGVPFTYIETTSDIRKF